MWYGSTGMERHVKMLESFDDAAVHKPAGDPS